MGVVAGDDFKRRRLIREGWPENAVENWEKAGESPAALLYHLLKVEGGVSTPRGQGTLYTARSSGCQVLLTRQKATGVDENGKRFRPLVVFAPEEITVYGKGKGK